MSQLQDGCKVKQPKHQSGITRLLRMLKRNDEDKEQ